MVSRSGCENLRDVKARNTTRKGDRALLGRHHVAAVFVDGGLRHEKHRRQMRHHRITAATRHASMDKAEKKPKKNKAGNAASDTYGSVEKETHATHKVQNKGCIGRVRQNAATYISNIHQNNHLDIRHGQWSIKCLSFFETFERPSPCAASHAS